MNQNEIRETLSKNIKRYLNKYDMTQADLARKLGVSGQTITNWVNGGGEPRMNKIDKMCEIFHCKRSDLLEEPPVYSKRALPEIPPYDGIFPIAVKRLPVLGYVSCGNPIFMNEEREVYVEVGTNIDAHFILIARGDSMINARIHEGDLVFIQSTPQVENGQIAVVAIGDEATLKRFYYYPETQQICLQSENPAYAPMIFTGQQLEDIRVLGRAIAFQSDVR